MIHGRKPSMMQYVTLISFSHYFGSKHWKVSFFACPAPPSTYTMSRNWSSIVIYFKLALKDIVDWSSLFHNGVICLCVIFLSIIDMNWCLCAGMKIHPLVPVSRSWLPNWRWSWRGMYHIATWTSMMSRAPTTTCLVLILVDTVHKEVTERSIG